MRKPLSYAASGLLLTLAAAAGNVHAAGNDISLGVIGQSTFDALIDELGTAATYNPISPAEPLGLTGFDIGVAVSMVSIDTAIWDNVVSDGAAPSTLPVPRVMVRKGLPLGIDIGVSRIDLPSSNVAVTGFELRKAILEGSTVSPAVSVLAHSSKLSGVSDVDLSSYGVDVGISKGFAMLTPYAGAGQVWIKGSDTRNVLADRSTSVTRSYAGVRFGFLPFMNMVVQADFAEVNSYSIRLNVGF